MIYKKLIIPLASLVILMAHPILSMNSDQHGLPAIAQKGDGREPGLSLIAAAKAGDVARVQYLLDAGVPIDQTDEYGDTALMWAALNGQEPIVRLLIHSGASINHTNHIGSTALLWAANRGHEPIVRLLLGAGALVNHANNGNWTALMGAAKCDSESTCTFLIERMLKIPSDAQRKRIYCALLCIKKTFCRDLYSLFKAPMFRALIEVENREDFQNSVAKQEIDKIGDKDMKEKLLDKYSQNDATPVNQRRQTIHDL